MQFWDTAGQEKFDSIVASYYKSAEVIILVYATNLRNSFERIPEWDKKVIEHGSEEEPIKILIGNKKDLEQERKVTFEEGENLAKQLGCIKFLEISCKNKENEEIEEKMKEKEDNKFIEFGVQKLDIKVLNDQKKYEKFINNNEPLFFIENEIYLQNEEEKGNIKQEGNYIIIHFKIKSK